MSVVSVARSASPTGLVAGLVFWFASLTPTLVPRGWIVQGVTSGACLAIGYGVGAMAERMAARALPRPRGGLELRRPRPAASVAVVPVVALAGMVAWAAWQDEARDLVGMPHLAWWEGPPMVALALIVATGLIWLGTAVGSSVLRAHGGIRRRLPARLPLPATVALSVAFVGVVGGQVVLRASVGAVNAVYEVLDHGTNPGIEPPMLPSVSGSPSSLVGWETMGLWGRDFAAGVTSRDELLAYHGSNARVRDPVRVFVGMRTADTVEERAAIAVREQIGRASCRERV